MEVGELLRQLDAKVLPPLGRALRWCTRGAVRRRVLLSTGVVAALGLLMASVWAARQPPVSPSNVGYVVRVGVADGQSVSSYADAADRELDELADGGGGPSYALVSFAAYLAPGRFGSALGDVEVHRAYARAPLEGLQTDVVEITIRTMPGDLRTGMAAVADRMAAQAVAYRRDAAKLTGSSEVERDQRQSYQDKAADAAVEAAAYRSLCSCLYAAVVRGTPDALDRLAGAAGVRTVDPAPEVVDLDRAVFVPPLPEVPDNPVSRPSPSVSPTPSESPSGSPSPSPEPSDSTPPSPSPSQTPSESPAASDDSRSPTGDEAGEEVAPAAAASTPMSPDEDG